MEPLAGQKHSVSTAIKHVTDYCINDEKMREYHSGLLQRQQLLQGCRAPCNKIRALFMPLLLHEVTQPCLALGQGYGGGNFTKRFILAHRLSQHSRQRRGSLYSAPQRATPEQCVSADLPLKQRRGIFSLLASELAQARIGRLSPTRRRLAVPYQKYSP